MDGLGDVEVHFFLRFTDCSGEVRGVGGITFAAGECDMRGPAVANAGRALDEQDFGGAVLDPWELEEGVEGAGWGEGWWMGGVRVDAED